MLRKWGTIFLISALALVAAGTTAGPAQAAYIVNLDEVGANVVATGSGTLDVTDLSGPFTGSNQAFIHPSVIGQILTGPAVVVLDSFYSGTITKPLTGPLSFGNGTAAVADSGSGSMVGIDASAPFDSILVPLGYVSGTPLSDTSTYDNQTFASLGVTPGTYVWTWGTGADADSFTLQIGPAAVPEPGSLSLMLSALAGLLGLGWLRSRSAT